MDCVEEAERREKNYRANFLGPISKHKIFINNPSRGVWLYYQILMTAKMSKTEICAKILKRNKIKVFIIRISIQAFKFTSRVKSVL